jgi:hypothetical protein
MERPEPSVMCKDCNHLGYLSFECKTNDDDTEICCSLCGKTGLLAVPAANKALYCTNCKTIVSQSWCLHGHNGCSSDVYYGLWLEIDGIIPIFSTAEEANEFFIKYKAKELNNITVKPVCGCFGNCYKEKYQCPKAYNTGNPYNDYIVECCDLNCHKNIKPTWYDMINCKSK